MKDFYLLDIDLTNEEFEITNITSLFRDFIGGTGVATKLFVDSCKSGVDPFSENAPIVFAIGPANNFYPVITKTVAVFKSPLTGDFGESHAGGNVALAMFMAGFHAIRIRGKAKEFSYLEISNDRVRVVRANPLRNLTSTATERILTDRYHNVKIKSIMEIGPAGERLSPIACVGVDSSRHFGRLGLGAVLGSKNIKAIVIFGNRYWEVPKGKYKGLYKNFYREVTESDLMYKYHSLGTAANVLPLNRINGLPVRNYSQGYFEGADGISGETLADRNLAQRIACANCPVGCIHVGEVRVMYDERNRMYKTKRVSYDHEPIYAFGSNLSINRSDDLLLLLNEVERQGWDVISMGVTLAWATEAFQRGIINQTHTLGKILNFGDVQTYLDVLKSIAEGASEFYRDLERGSYHCAKKYGGDEFAIVFNKNEAPGYLTGIMTFLGYAIDPRHSHLGNGGYSIDERLKNNETPIEDRMRELYEEGIWRIIFTSLGGCLFSRHVYHRKDVIPELLSAIGFDRYNDEKLFNIARKIHAMKYRFKMENDFNFDSLKLPEKLLRVVTSNGVMTQEEFKRGIEIFKNYLNKDLQLLKE